MALSARCKWRVNVCSNNQTQRQLSNKSSSNLSRYRGIRFRLSWVEVWSRRSFRRSKKRNRSIILGKQTLRRMCRYLALLNSSRRPKAKKIISTSISLSISSNHLLWDSWSYKWRRKFSWGATNWTQSVPPRCSHSTSQLVEEEEEHRSLLAHTALGSYSAISVIEEVQGRNSCRRAATVWSLFMRCACQWARCLIWLSEALNNVIWSQQWQEALKTTYRKLWGPSSKSCKVTEMLRWLTQQSSTREGTCRRQASSWRGNTISLARMRCRWEAAAQSERW